MTARTHGSPLVGERRDESRADQPRTGQDRADAAWACGLTPDEAARAGDRCQDVVPELIVELI